MIFSDTQLEFLFWLKELRGPFLDLFFLFLALFDTMEFLTALVAFIWIGFSRKWGIRIFYLTAFASFTCMAAKLFFSLPRPTHLYPELGLLQIRSFGFPSGGAQNGIMFASLLILYWKNRWASWIAFFYFAAISFSRIYLGVHYPMDLLGGWILGLINITIFYYGIKPLENLAQRHLDKMTFLSIALPLVLWLSFPASRLTPSFEILTAGGVGIWISRIFHQIPPTAKNRQICIGRGIYGALSTLAFFSMLTHPFFAYLWLSSIASLLFLKRRT